MNDDINSPIAIAHLFDGLRIVNLVRDGKETLSETDLEQLKRTYHNFAFGILGLKDEKSQNQMELVTGLVNHILEIRQQAKTNKDFATSDKIRNMLSELGIEVKDRKDGAEWSLK